MAKAVYVCFKCNTWFETQGEQRAHDCGKKPPTEPAKAVETSAKKAENKVEPIIEDSKEIKNNETSNETENEGNVELDKKEDIDALKKAKKPKSKSTKSK